MSQSHRELAVEVDRGEGPISGRVRAKLGPTLTFVGWLGLIAVLDRLLSDDTQPRQEEL